MPSGKKRTHQEFISELQKNNPSAENIIVLGNYEKNASPIMCKCKKCGYVWSPTPKALLNGHGCPKCNNNAKLTHDEYVERLKKDNPNYESIELLQQYDGMSKRISCRCKKCDTVWAPKANDLLRAKTGCPSCSGNIQFTHERFMKEFEKRNKYHDSIEIISQYNGSLERIKCRCKICNFIWEPLASSLIQGTGCPECAEKRVAQTGRDILKHIPKPTPMSHNDFLSKFNSKNPYSRQIEITSSYKGANKRIKCQCKICGKTWEPLASSLLQGTGCPNCSHTSTSFMEQFLFQALLHVLGDNEVKNRDKMTIGREIDILLPKYNYGIEIGSWNWHKNTINNDLEKNRICKDKGIYLLVIFDSCKETLNLGNNFLIYPFDLGSESDHITLKSIVNKILNVIEINYCFSEEEWEHITKLAYIYSVCITHDEYIKKLQESNSHYDSFEILNEYTRATDKIKCRCKICGNEWCTVASELIRGSGCPVCQIKKVGERKSKKSIIKEWRKNNPTGNKLQCEKQTGISRMTVYKWWDE